MKKKICKIHIIILCVKIRIKKKFDNLNDINPHLAQDLKFVKQGFCTNIRA